jgi:hypothetical protein
MTAGPPEFQSTTGTGSVPPADELLGNGNEDVHDF